MATLLKFIGIIVVGSLATIGAMVYLSSPADSPIQPPASSAGTERNGQGTFGRHQFVYTLKNDTAVAVFTPFLPRDDAALIGGTTAVIRAVFLTELGSESPTLVGREIRFVAGNGDFFVTPVKQDTGEIHSLAVRFVRR